MTEYVRYIAGALLELISLLLLVRAILSWIPPARDTKIAQIVYMLTEPFLLPYRMLFDKLGIGRGFFLDLSFLATILTLQLLTALL
ncbi:MAG: YggT family protein [Clostridia bacterium]|nr:YggT family protein [Clostridia bacterium]